MAQEGKGFKEVLSNEVDVRVEAVSKAILIDVLGLITEREFAEKFPKAVSVIEEKGSDQAFVDAVEAVHEEIDERSAEIFPEEEGASWWAKVVNFKDPQNGGLNSIQYAQTLRVVAVMACPLRREFILTDD